MKQTRKWITIFLIPSVLLFVFVFGASIVILTGSSFTSWTIGSEIEFAGLHNYKELLTNEDFLRALLNTGIWILLQATVNTVIGLVFALILQRKPFYWKWARAVYMLPNVISSAALGMLFLCFFNPSFGFVNQIISAIIGQPFDHNWFMSNNTAFGTVTMTWLPFAAVGTLLILAEIASIPEDIFEAAKIDGASEWQIVWRITLPMLRNIIGTCSVLGGTYMLKTLDVIMITTSGGPGNRTMNVPLFIYQSALRSNNFALANCAGVILIALGLLTVVVIRKIFSIGKGY